MAGMNPEIQEALKRGIEECEAAITAATSTLKAAEVIGTREYLNNDYLKRAVAAKLGRFAQSPRSVASRSLTTFVSPSRLAKATGECPAIRERTYRPADCSPWRAYGTSPVTVSTA